MPSASIVVPVWNGEKMLPSCLNSILRQDFDSPEIIIVDDGSTDGSLQIAKDAMIGKENIRIISHSANLGLSSTISEGIKEAKGEFVQIIHQDCEIVDKNYLSSAVASLRADPRIAAVTGRRVYQIDTLSDKEKLFMVANGHIPEMNHRGHVSEELTFTELKCDLLRKSSVERVGGLAEPRFRVSGQDQLLGSQLRDMGFKLMRLDSICYSLGFGTGESTLRGTVKKIFVYGKTQAGVFLTRRRSSLNGVFKSKTLSSKAFNRLQMTIGASLIILGIILSAVNPYFVFLSIATGALRVLTYARGLAKVRGRIRFAPLGLLLDAVYSIGFFSGLISSVSGRSR